MTCNDFNLDPVKQAIAMQYGVHIALISISNPCVSRRRLQSDGLSMTVNIAEAGATIDGKTVAAPPMTDLLASIESVDDAVLASAISAELGATITLTSTSPIRASVTRIIVSVCPRGFWCTANIEVPCEVSSAFQSCGSYSSLLMSCLLAFVAGGLLQSNAQCQQPIGLPQVP